MLCSISHLQTLYIVSCVQARRCLLQRKTTGKCLTVQDDALQHQSSTNASHSQVCAGKEVSVTMEYNRQVLMGLARGLSRLEGSVTTPQDMGYICKIQKCFTLSVVCRQGGVCDNGVQQASARGGCPGG